VVVVAGQLRPKPLVGRRRLDLPALGIEDQLGERVVVDLERRPGPLDEAAQRLDLGLGRRAAAKEGLRARLGRRALEVVVPLRRPVAVRVDAVDVGDRAVGVVVVEVLAPEPRGGRGERVVVAVGVGDRHEPRLVLGQQSLIAFAAGLVLVVDDVLEEPALDLG
jgi:hypothetical protein